MNQYTFVKNVSIRLLFSIAVKFHGLLVLPLLTHMYSQEIYGAWLQIILVKDLLPGLLRLKFEIALVRYLSLEKDCRHIVKAAFTMTSVACLLFILFVLFLKREMSFALFGTQAFSSLTVAAAIWMTMQSFLGIGLAVLRSEEKIRRLSMLELMSGLWIVCAAGIAFVCELDISTLAYLCAAGDAVLTLWLLHDSHIYIPFVPPWESFAAVKKYITYSGPLILNTLFLWITKSVDRLLIVHFLGLSYAGIYGVNLQITLLLAVLLSPVNFVLFPRVARAWNENRKEEVNQYFSQALTITLLIAAPVTIGLLVLSEGLIVILAGEGYTAGKMIQLVLLVSATLLAVYQNHIYAIHLKEKTYLLPVLFIAGTLMNCLFGYMMVRHMGLMGAAIARLTVFSMMALAASLLARRYIRFRVPWPTILKVILISILMGLSISWFPTDSLLQIVFGAVCAFVVFAVLIVLSKTVTFRTLMTIKKDLI